MLLSSRQSLLILRSRPHLEGLLAALPSHREVQAPVRLPAQLPAQVQARPVLRWWPGDAVNPTRI